MIEAQATAKYVRTSAQKAGLAPIKVNTVVRRGMNEGGIVDIARRFRGTGITTYLENGGELEKAAQMANHSSTRTTQLYDRRADEVTLDEVERIII